MSFTDVAPYLGLLAALALGVWQARARSGADLSLEAGDSLLRQYEALGHQLRDAQRDARRSEWAYLDLLAWSIRAQQQVAQEAPGVKLPPLPQRAVNGERPAPPPMTDRDEVKLRRLLVERMEAEDLKTLAFDLGCENLSGATTGEMARTLLDFVRTRRKWTELQKWLTDNRPDIQL